MGRRSRWACWPAARSSPPSAPPSTAASASRTRPSSGRATGAAPTTTAIRRREALAVHESAGVIDVSTLGKLLVRGPGRGRAARPPVPNRLSNLKPGRMRYGVMTSDAGRIIDDGTVCRLDDDTFYVTTTSSGAAAIEEWFGWWLATWDLDARVTDVTQGLAAINLAGPAGARDPRRADRRSTCPPTASRTWTRGAHASRAWTCLLLRIGFVGEVGYEIHFPAAYGEHVVGRARRGGRAAVRARAAARPAPAEAARDRRPGHGLRVDAVRCRDAVDRQARQGGGLHRPLGARARRRATRGDGARRLHHGRRPRADRGRGRRSPSGGPPGR